VLGTLLPALAGLERRSLSKFAASILAAGSVLVIVKQGAGTFNATQGSLWYTVGCGLGICEQVLVVSSNMLVRELTRELPPVRLIAASTAVSAALLCALLLLAAVLGVAPADFGPLLTPAGSMGLAFAVLGVTCLGYSLKALGLKHLPTSTATAYSAGQPAVAVLIAAATLGEPLTPTVGIGITGVTGALVVLARLA
jgi:drug/metabolite transporter (DMT)-like permease